MLFRSIFNPYISINIAVAKSETKKVIVLIKIPVIKKAISKTVATINKIFVVFNATHLNLANAILLFIFAASFMRSPKNFILYIIGENSSLVKQLGENSHIIFI